MNTPDTKEEQGLSHLERVDCKTGNGMGQGGRIYRSWSGGRCRILGGEKDDYCYHVMSRTCGGDALFGHEEKEAFRRIMRRMARFSGVKVLTYCVMNNHFHILARVPDREGFLRRFDDREGEEAGAGEERLMGQLLILYSKAYVARVRQELKWMREQGMEADAVKFLEKYKRRFCDLSLFVKEVKERFSRWYNKKYDRRGTLWMDRFKSVLVEDGEALRTMAAYIDLNPVRAGLVEDPRDYRWCGYAEALGGSRQARRGLCRIMGKPLDSWAENGSWYRCWLMIDGEEVLEDEARQIEARKGISSKKVQEELERGGELSYHQRLRSRIRYFTEGVALGGEAFVQGLFEDNREKFGPSRRVGAKPVGCEGKPDGEEKGTSFFALQRGKQDG